MQIKGPSPLPPGTPVANAVGVQRQWSPGQILTASVVAAGPRQALQLTIAGETFFIQGANTLRPGQVVRLQVSAPARDAILRLGDGNGPALRLPVPPQAQGWQRGELLQARLLPPPAEAPGTPLLEIGGRRLPLAASSHATLPPGNLRLSVIDPGRPAVLRLLADDTQAIRDQALRQALPRQQALGGLLAALQPLSEPVPGRVPLPMAVSEGIRALLAALPQREAVVAGGEQLRQALLRSGPFLEARLAEAVAQGLPGLTAENDLKAGLLGLLARLLGLRLPTAPTDRPPRPAGADAPPPLPGGQPAAQARVTFDTLDDAAETLRQLRQQVEGALARVQLGQLASLPAEDDGRRAWLLELPLRQPDGQVDVLALRFEEEAARGHADESPRWQVSLALDLPGLGPVQAHIALRGGSVSARFQAESAATVRLFEHHLSELQQRLRAAGLAVGSLAAAQATGETPATGTGNGLPRGLLDEEA